jgi:hypothetical protein
MSRSILIYNCHAKSVLFVWLITVLFSQNKPATNNQPAVLFFPNKPSPVISHQPNDEECSALGKVCQNLEVRPDCVWVLWHVAEEVAPTVPERERE